MIVLIREHVFRVFVIVTKVMRVLIVLRGLVLTNVLIMELVTKVYAFATTHTEEWTALIFYVTLLVTLIMVSVTKEIAYVEGDGWEWTVHDHHV